MWRWYISNQKAFCLPKLVTNVMPFRSGVIFFNSVGERERGLQSASINGRYPANDSNSFQFPLTFQNKRHRFTVINHLLGQSILLENYASLQQERWQFGRLHNSQIHSEWWNWGFLPCFYLAQAYHDNFMPNHLTGCVASWWESTFACS